MIYPSSLRLSGNITNKLLTSRGISAHIHVLAMVYIIYYIYNMYMYNWADLYLDCVSCSNIGEGPASLFLQVLVMCGEDALQTGQNRAVEHHLRDRYDERENARKNVEKKL